MNLLLIHVHEFSPFPCVFLMEAALHFPELSCTLQHASPFVLIIQKFHIMPQYGAILDSTVFRHRGRGTKNDGNVHGQRQLTNHITCSSESLVNAFFLLTHSRTCQHALSL